MCSRLLPTPEQYEAFAHHVCQAHSWYKHIPLLDGAEFVFFLSEDAGNGYSDENPRLHYGWKTTEEYRHRFGYLDYMYCLPEEATFNRDGQAESVTIPQELLSSCGAVLYPFASNDFNAPGVLAEILTEESLEALRAANSYPRQQDVLKWYEVYQIQQYKWQQLSDSEREIAISVSSLWNHNYRTSITEEFAELPLSVAEYLRSQMKGMNLYRILQEGELNKVRYALTQVHALLYQVRLISYDSGIYAKIGKPAFPLLPAPCPPATLMISL